MTTWWAAVSGGSFYTRWSAVLSLLVAGVFSVPAVGGTGVEAYLRGASVAILGWALLAALLVPVAVAERRLRSRTVRGILVLVALGVAATVRSGVNDVISVALFDIVPAGPVSSRIATNLVTAFALLSIIAVITSRHADARSAADRLRIALARVEGADARRQRVMREARVAAVSGVAVLRAARERMLAGTVDFDAVRAFSDQVRELSHVLDRMLRSRAETGTETGAEIGAAPGFARRLVAPPWLCVGPLYAVACLPYAVGAGGPGVALAGLVTGAVIDLAAGVAVRRWAPPPRRAPLFLLVWLAGGTAMSIVTYVFLPDVGVLGLVPVFAVPVVAILVSLCRDALARARDDESSATAGLAEVARDAAAADLRAGASIRRAIDLLHGRAQGACVVFAALADERAPTPAETTAFRRRVDAAFDEISDPTAATGPVATLTLGEVLDPILQTWEPAVEVTRRIGDTAAALAAPPETGDRVTSIVTEALVNAVKHSGARHAEIAAELVTPGLLRLRVASPGHLGPLARRGLGSIDARLLQEGDTVVLEALVDVETDTRRDAHAAASEVSLRERAAG